MWRSDTLAGPYRKPLGIQDPGAPNNQCFVKGWVLYGKHLFTAYAAVVRLAACFVRLPGTELTSLHYRPWMRPEAR
jgi:hypothetical protein